MAQILVWAPGSFPLLDTFLSYLFLFIYERRGVLSASAPEIGAYIANPQESGGALNKTFRLFFGSGSVFSNIGDNFLNISFCRLA